MGLLLGFLETEMMRNAGRVNNSPAIRKQLVSGRVLKSPDRGR